MKARLTRVGLAVLASLSTVIVLSLSGPVSAGGRTNQAHNQGAPPDRIVIDVVTVNGSGCPAGTAYVSVSPDNTHFRVIYRDFIARAGAGADPIDFRKNCQLNLQIHIPQGFTYAIGRADYRGFALLRRGATGLHRTAYYFQGSSDTVYKDHSFDGPFRDQWRSTDVTEIAELVFAPCGRDVNLNINTELRVHAGAVDGRSSFMAMNVTDGSIHTLYHFHWRQCH
jgi:hypothetical protein